MSVSREFAVAELESVKKAMTLWIRELKDASGYANGDPKNIPYGESVSDLQHIPISQFRAELMACAAKLEALSATSGP